VSALTAASPSRPVALTALRLVHTATWLSIESCMVYVLVSGLAGRSDRRVAIAAGVVVGETAIFAASGFRCPLTSLAENLGEEHGSVTDIYLPAWFARNLPVIHVPLIAAAAYLHARNLGLLPGRRPT
jgi:hypothetical protein